VGDRGLVVPDRTPYDVVTRAEVARPTPKSLLTALCRGLEREAFGDPPAVAAVTLQDVRHLTPATLEVYAALARAGTAVTMFGRGLRAWLAPGVRGVALDDDDPLGDVWSVVFLGGRRPVAMAALDLFTDGVTDAARPFRVATTRDQALVAACARVLGVGPGSVSGTAVGGTRQA
jgi:hypothetical protein